MAKAMMKYAYPALSITDPPLALRIARHSHCHLCHCKGLQPPQDAHLVLDTARPHQILSLGHLRQYGDDDDKITPDYLDICECGHGLAQHGADESAIGHLEFRRRARVATRLDELLQVRPFFIFYSAPLKPSLSGCRQAPRFRIHRRRYYFIAKTNARSGILS